MQCDESVASASRNARAAGCMSLSCLPEDAVVNVLHHVSSQACFTCRSVSSEWLALANREIQGRTTDRCGRRARSAVIVTTEDFLELSASFEDMFGETMGRSDPAAYRMCVRILNTIDSVATPHVNSSLRRESCGRVLRVTTRSRFERHGWRVKLEGIEPNTGVMQMMWLHDCWFVAPSLTDLTVPTRRKCLLH